MMWSLRDDEAEMPETIFLRHYLSEIMKLWEVMIPWQLDVTSEGWIENSSSDDDDDDKISTPQDN